jgi:hypothetical protein
VAASWPLLEANPSLPTLHDLLHRYRYRNLAGRKLEPNPSVARYEENTREIRSILRPSILRLFFGSVSRLAKGIRKYIVATYFERVSLRIFRLPSPYLPTYFQRYVGHTYVLNNDEGLTERAQDIPVL